MTRVINRHGLKIDGLREACTETRALSHTHGMRVELLYLKNSGAVVAMKPRDYERSARPVADALGFIYVGSTFQPMTMQAIADAVYRAVMEG